MNLPMLCSKRVHWRSWTNTFAANQSKQHLHDKSYWEKLGISMEEEKDEFTLRWYVISHKVKEQNFNF